MAGGDRRPIILVVYVKGTKQIYALEKSLGNRGESGGRSRVPSGGFCRNPEKKRCGQSRVLLGSERKAWLEILGTMRLEEELLRKTQGPRPTPDFSGDGRAARWPVSSGSAGSARGGGRSLRGERGRELPGRRGCSERRRCWRGAVGSGPPLAIAGALENRGRERAPTPVPQERTPTDRGERGRSVPRGRESPTRSPARQPPARCPGQEPRRDLGTFCRRRPRSPRDPSGEPVRCC